MASGYGRPLAPDVRRYGAGGLVGVPELVVGGALELGGAVLGAVVVLAGAV
jgi:hypothetical protein